MDQWLDRSGNNNNAAFAAGQPATRPAEIAGSANGYPTIDFDGSDDQLLVPHHSSLNLNEWDIFLVGAVDVAKNNNAWLSKGSSNTTPNYAMWSPSDGSMQLPIRSIFGTTSTPTTPGGVMTTSFRLAQYTNSTIFFGLVPARRFYTQGTSVYSDLSVFQWPQTNSQPLRIGGVNGQAGWFLDGDIAEMIVFNTAVNSAQRIIINNYLSAKYDFLLTSNDIYTQDNALNGNYDHDVAGIGRVNSSNQQTDSRGTGIVRISGASNLNDNEFLIWGHDNDILGTWGSVDLPPGIEGRWFRTWRVSEVNSGGSAVDVGSVTIDFDLTGITPVTTGDIRLLVDTDNDGIFANETPIGPPTSMGGNIYRFTGISQLVNGRRFTLATTNIFQTPLPVELVHFDAEALPPTGVELTWSTATEMNNDHFTIQRSSDLLSWETLGEVEGQGTTLELTEYSFWDEEPLADASYYRLLQVDHDGKEEPSSVRSVTWSSISGPLVAPNPNNGFFQLRIDPEVTALVHVLDGAGRVVWSSPVPVTGTVSMDLAHLPSGTYTVIVGNDRARVTERVVIER